MFSTITKFSQITGLSKGMIRKLIRQNILKYIKIGRQYRVLTPESITILKSYSSATPTEIYHDTSKLFEGINAKFHSPR